MMGNQGNVDVIVSQQNRGGTGVFRQHKVCFAQDLERAEGNVLQIADRSGHYEQSSFHTVCKFRQK